MTNMTDGILMEIILALVHKTGGPVSVTRDEVDEAYKRFEAGNFFYGPQPDGTFLLEFRDEPTS